MALQFFSTSLQSGVAFKTWDFKDSGYTPMERGFSFRNIINASREEGTCRGTIELELSLVVVQFKGCFKHRKLDGRRLSSYVPGEKF